MIIRLFLCSVGLLALVRPMQVVGLDSDRQPDTKECNAVLSLAEPELSNVRQKVDRCVQQCKAVLDAPPAHALDDPFAKMCGLQRQRNSTRPPWATI
jgi:hypothetical protein